MKLVFTKLETPATEIKVAFDGVNYKPYNVDEIKSVGYISFTEEECPDLTKVKIQGKFSTLGSVEVNKSIELERGEGGESGIKFTKWYCFNHIYGYQTLNDKVYCDHLPESWYYGMEDVPVIYEKTEDGEFVEAPYQPFNGGGDVEGIDYDFFVYYGRNREGFFKRYEEGDITEVITEIQEVPTITKSGQTVADEGKAFKSVKIHGIVGSIPNFNSDVGPDSLKEYFTDEFIDPYECIEAGTVLKPINLLISNDNIISQSDKIALFVPLEVGDVISDKIESSSGYQISGALTPRSFDYVNNILHCWMQYPM